MPSHYVERECAGLPKEIFSSQLIFNITDIKINPKKIVMTRELKTHLACTSCHKWNDDSRVLTKRFEKSLYSDDEEWIVHLWWRQF